MILRRANDELKAAILLAFTSELIRNSIPKDILLKQSFKEPERELEIQPVSEINERVKEDIQKQRIVRSEFKPLPTVFAPRPRPTGPVRIPRQIFPQRLQYIHPVPMRTEIDLGAINKFAKDPMISSIECNGAGIPIIVRSRRGTMPTKITLNEQEIKDVINKFAEKSKIPIDEGVYRVAVGRLVLASIISDITGSKFVISKIGYR